MIRFAEDPTPAILLGLAALAIAVILYLQTRRTGAFIAILVVVLITLLAVVVERLILTEKERVEVVIYGIAEAAEANDMPGVLAFLSPRVRSEIRRHVEREMPRSTIERARVLGKLTITIDETSSPMTAHAEFQGFISGQWGRDRVNFGQRADIDMFLEKTNDTWRITEAEGIER